MTSVLHSFTPGERHRSRLSADVRGLALERRVVPTSVGRIVVRVATAAPVRTTHAILLVHGAAGSWTTWTPLLRAAVRDGIGLCDVIAVDLPGFGESPDAAARPGVVAAGRALCEIARALDYETWTVVGHSLGGFLALEMAAREPSRTRGVLAISPSGPGVLAAIRRPVRGGRALPWFAGMLLVMRVLAAMGRTGRRLVLGLQRIGLLRILVRPLFADPAGIDASVVEALAHEIRPRSFVDATASAARYDESIWRSIRCPVRAVRGEHDVFAGSADERGLREMIPSVRQRTVRGAGHFAAVEQPAAVLRILRELIDDRDVGREL